MRTQDQRRAARAYGEVERVRTWSSDKQEKFKSLALKFPAMILQCGALQTLAFYRSKEKDTEIFKILDDWLLSAEAGLPWSGTGGATVVERLCHSNMELSRYRLITREALAYGTWLKRAAETLLKVSGQDNG